MTIKIFSNTGEGKVQFSKAIFEKSKEKIL